MPYCKWACGEVVEIPDIIINVPKLIVYPIEMMCEDQAEQMRRAEHECSMMSDKACKDQKSDGVCKYDEDRVDAGQGDQVDECMMLDRM